MSTPPDKTQDISIEVRCSTACTRAGLTAIILSAIAFSMLQPLIDAKALNALSKYTALRINLREALNQLDDDSCWKVLVKSDLGGQSPKKINLGELLLYQCKYSSKNPSQPELFQPPAQKSTPKKEGMMELGKLYGIRMGRIFHAFLSVNISPDHAHAQDTTPPAAPKDLQVIYAMPILEIERIVDSLTELGDGELLSSARSLDSRFDYSIYRWGVLRNQIITKNTSKDMLVIPGSKHSEDDTHYVGNVTREEILKYLNLEEVKKLSDYEYPDLTETQSLLESYGRLKLPWSPVPIGLLSSTLSIEVGLLISVFYFWLFQNEARFSGSFPVPGTLFRAFGRSRTFKISFGLFATLPPSAAALLAIKSIFPLYIAINMTLAVLTVLITLRIVYEARSFLNE